MSDEPTCPYCNACLIPAPGGIVPCPRCGETVNVPETRREAATPPAVTTVPYRKPMEANRRTAWVILAVMGAMAATGLAYALLTVSARRAHDKNIPRASRRPVLPPLLPEKEVSPTSPARMAALAWLPPGGNAVAGVHVAELLASPVGDRLKSETLRLGKLELSLGSVERWLGVPAGNIDHLAVGSVLMDAGEALLTPPTVLVLRTREPIGVNRLREALQAGTARMKGDKRVAEGKIAGLPVVLWLPNPKTAVVGLFTDLRDVPSRPAEALERLSAPVRSALEERLAGATVAWVVAHSDDWTKSPFLGGIPAMKGLPLGDVRTLAAWVPAASPLRVQAAIQAPDEAAAKRLEVEAAKQVGVQHAREGEWLSLQRTIRE